MLDNIFRLDIVPGKLYAVEEGTIGDEFGSWGGSFFDFSVYNRSTPAFSTGVLLFKPCDDIQTLFKNTTIHVHSHLREIGRPLPCLEQPCLVYNAFIEEKYDNQCLNPYVKNRPTGIESGILIYHFAGHPGNYSSKEAQMLAFLKQVDPPEPTVGIAVVKKPYFWLR